MKITNDIIVDTITMINFNHPINSGSEWRAYGSNLRRNRYYNRIGERRWKIGRVAPSGFHQWNRWNVSKNRIGCTVLNRSRDSNGIFSRLCRSLYDRNSSYKNSKEALIPKDNRVRQVIYTEINKELRTSYTNLEFRKRCHLCMCMYLICTRHVK